MNLPQGLQLWLLTLQLQLQLIVVDTTTGSVESAPPPAGLNSSTGQSNQNQELVIVKSSPDANTVTATGIEGGPYVLTTQYQFMRIKSDGTNWWRVG
jgi:hypothetical protein